MEEQITTSTLFGTLESRTILDMGVSRIDPPICSPIQTPLPLVILTKSKHCTAAELQAGYAYLRQRRGSNGETGRYIVHRGYVRLT